MTNSGATPNPGSRLPKESRDQLQLKPLQRAVGDLYREAELLFDLIYHHSGPSEPQQFAEQVTLRLQESIGCRDRNFRSGRNEYGSLVEHQTRLTESVSAHFKELQEEVAGLLALDKETRDNLNKPAVELATEESELLEAVVDDEATRHVNFLQDRLISLVEISSRMHRELSEIASESDEHDFLPTCEAHCQQIMDSVSKHIVPRVSELIRARKRSFHSEVGSRDRYFNIIQLQKLASETERLIPDGDIGSIREVLQTATTDHIHERWDTFGKAYDSVVDILKNTHHGDTSGSLETLVSNRERDPAAYDQAAVAISTVRKLQEALQLDMSGAISELETVRSEAYPSFALPPGSKLGFGERGESHIVSIVMDPIPFEKISDLLIQSEEVRITHGWYERNVGQRKKYKVYALQGESNGTPVHNRYSGALIYSQRDNQVCIHDFIVDKVLRRQGYGQALFEDFVHQFEAHYPLKAVVSEKNIFGRLFLHSMGFQTVNSQYRHDRNFAVGKVLELEMHPKKYSYRLHQL